MDLSLPGNGGTLVDAVYFLEGGDVGLICPREGGIFIGGSTANMLTVPLDDIDTVVALCSGENVISKSYYVFEDFGSGVGGGAGGTEVRYAGLMLIFSYCIPKSRLHSLTVVFFLNEIVLYPDSFVEVLDMSQAVTLITRFHLDRGRFVTELEPLFFTLNPVVSRGPEFYRTPGHPTSRTILSDGERSSRGSHRVGPRRPMSPRRGATVATR